MSRAFSLTCHSSRQINKERSLFFDFGKTQNLLLGKPGDHALCDQYVAEVYYRWQAARYLRITPDVQLILDPSRNAPNDVIGVFGLRARIVLILSIGGPRDLSLCWWSKR